MLYSTGSLGFHVCLFQCVIKIFIYFINSSVIKIFIYFFFFNSIMHFGHIPRVTFYVKGYHVFKTF